VEEQASTGPGLWIQPPECQTRMLEAPDQAPAWASTLAARVG